MTVETQAPTLSLLALSWNDRAFSLAKTMSRISLSLASLVAVAASAAAQTPRPSVQASTASPSNAGQVAVDADADLIAICWGDGTTDEVYVSVSDARGLS